ncbi:MAG: hypothetical protein AAB649_04185 [Patescibacteria group bacterium]
MSGTQLLQNIWTYIVDPAMLLLFTAGFLVFVYGLVVFLWHLKDGTGHDEGVNHMLWGIIGMFIMVSVWGIIALLVNTVGADPTNPDPNRLNNITVPNLPFK